MSNTFFSSDHHYFHKRIHEYCPDTRPWGGDLDLMTESLIEYHNDMVKPYDDFYHLGDFSFGTVEQTEMVLSRLNGKLHFIRGNHDNKLDKCDTGKYLTSYTDYLEVKVSKSRFLHLFHYPIFSWKNKSHGDIHLHGHLHQYESGVPGRIMSVCWDREGRYYTLEEILEKMNKIDFKDKYDEQRTAG